MAKFTVLILLFVATIASAQPLLTPDSHFFGIPSIDSLSTSRFLALTDSTDDGYFEPRDVEVLRLSPTDYRRDAEVLAHSLTYDGDI